ncbi:MAG: aspartate aminotransferase family protein [Clostridia bacterium]|nr:aspartate aminotransferase family protein [Clostridia bacterium]
MKTIPEYGLPYEEVLAQLEAYGAEDPDYKSAKTWSLVYYKDAEYTHFLSQAFEKYMSANGLNPTAFKSLKRFENDIVAFTAELLHAGENATGCVTSCGTESCMLAVKTYRDYARQTKHITHPEMIVSQTAHVAWFKGAEYFGVKLRVVPLDENYRIDLREVKKRINRNTIMILGSAPEYPHGIIDPIAELGALGKKHNIPVHVDCCVGGYLLPFMEQAGAQLPLFDFRAPGVTGMTADIHKYGFAAKGCSCILYADPAYFRAQCFVKHDWPGGVFASPALLGTRPGGAYAAAWAAIRANGRQGYIEMAKQTMENADRIRNGIREIPELELIGDPLCSLISYRSVDPVNCNIFAIGDQMQAKGWHIDRLQHPDALHAMITCAHTDVVDAYLADLREAVDAVRGHPELAFKGDAATYSVVGHLPLDRIVKKNVLEIFAKGYETGAGDIELSDGAAITGNEKLDGIVNKLILKDMEKPGLLRKSITAAKVSAVGVLSAGVAAIGAGIIKKGKKK